MKAIETRELTKQYGKITAVHSLNLSVEEGELFALLGVNGAGKTTTIRMLTGLSAPTFGTATVCGKSVNTQSSEIKNEIGISTQDTAVAEKLTVLENLEFMAGIRRNLNKKEQKQSAEEMIHMFHMEEVQNRLAKKLSGGWQRKLSIAMALIGQPKVLFLDEPTLGLDVLARRELWKIIRELKGKTTIVLTTHYMEEAQELADRIGVMVHGEMITVGTLHELEEQTGKKGLEEVFISLAEGRECV